MYMTTLFTLYYYKEVQLCVVLSYNWVQYSFFRALWLCSVEDGECRLLYF